MSSVFATAISIISASSKSFATAGKSLFAKSVLAFSMGATSCDCLSIMVAGVVAQLGTVPSHRDQFDQPEFACEPDDRY